MSEMNQTAERTIILHYHLFKNAGTSLDEILKYNFGDKWVEREFPLLEGGNTDLVEKWIKDTPDKIAYSSHTMVGPIPQLVGVRIITFLLLRDPIKRIMSAYKHEATETIDSPGVRLAKANSFEGYVAARLQNLSDRQCRNFHVHRLGSLCVQPGATELELSKLALANLTVVGRVESFMGAIKTLKAALGSAYPDFQAFSHATNLSKFKSELAPPSDFLDYLAKINRQDYELLDYYKTIVVSGSN